MSLPRPVDLGFPSKFTGWRKNQDDAILDLAASEVRFSGLVAPTGSGKSLTYMAYARLIGAGRVCVLTSTKSLQDQLEGDFRELDVRGKANYLCARGDVDPGVTVEEAPCQSGMYCEMRDNRGGDGKIIPGHGCLYYDKVKEARKAEVVVTNYAFWLSANLYGKGLGPFDLLVLDEAHAAPDELAGFLSFTLQAGEVRSLVRMELPGEGTDEWWEWLKRALAKVDYETAFVKGKGTREASERLKRLGRMGRPIAQCLGIGKENWVAEKMVSGTRSSMTWDITDPAPFAEKYLFRETPRVVLSSATVREKTLRLLGVEKDESEMLEYPSNFPAGRRPVYAVGGAPRLNHRTSEGELEVWRRKIDEIIGGRLDRRGIIHTVSFRRAKEIEERSEHRGIMEMHGSGSRELQEGIARYLKRKPSVLVSPSATTGIDLPYDECEYAIIAKIPYPDMRSKAMKARMKKDRDYPAYLAAQVMVQASGRGMRAEDDQQETLVVDGNWGWFMRKYSAFTPRWWRAAVRKVERLPNPPPALLSRR